MITSFLIVAKNGYCHPPGEFPPEIPIMDFFTPEYQPDYYSWEHKGKLFTRKCDPPETQNLTVLPNLQNLIITQSPEKYDPDNLLILNPDGTENHRLINPYRFYSEYQEGDEFEFLSPQAADDKLMVKISVCRTLTGKPYNFEPTYGTFYNCDTWDHTPLEFIDSRNL
jgi:hypothetical protein